VSDIDPGPGSGSGPVAGPEEALPDRAESAVPWSRLNPRMLFVHPLRELIRYLPILLIALVAGSVGGEPWWVYALSGFGIVVGLLQFFTTTYRITETHVQVKRGILNRRTLSVPRDRIRSVDVDSTMLHRLFRVSVMKIGTGASHGQDRLEFNAVATRDVPALRRELLRRAPSDTAARDTESETVSEAANLSRWQPAWVRYAPFTLSGVASIFVVAVFLLQIQFFDGGLVTRLPLVSQTIGAVSRVPFLTALAWGAVILLVLASVVAAVRYALSYGRFTISRVDASTLHITHGLLRTRQVTLDERRLRGITLSEPLSLRALRAGTAHAIMTGLGRERGGVALLAPPGPQEEALRISTEVLNTGVPLTCELTPHGTRAHWRRYTRAAEFAGVIAAGAAVLQLAGVVGPSVWWLFVFIVPASAFLARDRFRGLGHALLPGWLVMRSGSLNRKRSILATEGIIGWTIRRSYFQRRAGLATLIATTAAGRHKYEIPDLPYDRAWPIIESISLKRERLSAQQVLALFARSV